MEEFLIEYAHAEICGFSDNVKKIVNAQTGELICYVNNKKEIYFDKLINHTKLYAICEFIKKMCQ